MKLRGARPLVLVFAFLVAPLAAVAQSANIPRIGVLSGSFPKDDPCLEPLRRGLSELGYVEGRTHFLEPRWAETRIDPFPRLAAELVALKVDLIITASMTAVLAAKEATKSIPIVMASSVYPVELGVVASLAHPGGNVTGVTHFTPELMAKRVQLLKDLVPELSRLHVLRSPGRLDDAMMKDVESGARQLGVRVHVTELQRPSDLESAFDAAVQRRAQAVMNTQGPFFFFNRVQIAQLALKHRLPSLSGEPFAAEAGALLFYGPNVFEGCRRAARHVDRILKGVKPADLPVEQATKIEMVVNVKTAKALGLALPPSLLLRADKLIQ